MSQGPIPKAGILDIAPYTAGKSKAAPGVEPIKLSSNENPLGPSPRALAAYQAASQVLHRYPDAAHLALREAIGRVHSLPAEQLICGAGSDELIGLLCHAYAGLGDEVMISEHGFLMYKIYAMAAGAQVVAVPEKALKTEVDAVIAAITPRTKIIFLANPNNPTGTYLTVTEIKQLLDALPPHVLLVLDGAYSEYAQAGDYTDGAEWVSTFHNCVMLRTFSKAYGLPALRLGWAYAPLAVIDVLNRIRGPFNLSTPALLAGIAAVEDVAYTQAMVEHNTKWLGWLVAQLAALGLHVVPSQGNFLLVKFPESGPHTAQRINEGLLKQGFIVREVANYGLPSYLRITVGTEEQNRQFIAVLAKLLTA